LRIEGTPDSDVLRRRIPKTITLVPPHVADVRQKLVGHWKFVSCEEREAEGNRTTRNIAGRILYDQAGNMSTHLYPIREHDSNVAPGYLAYFGTFEIGLSADVIIHSAEASNIAQWVDTDLLRYYEFSEDRLTLSLRRNGRVTRALTGERLR
jgi:hypothetical protein